MLTYSHCVLDLYLPFDSYYHFRLVSHHMLKMVVLPMEMASQTMVLHAGAMTMTLLVVATVTMKMTLVWNEMGMGTSYIFCEG